MTSLVSSRKCPAYLLPSKQFLGRCIPTFGLVKQGEEASTRMESKMNSIQTSPGGETLDKEGLLEGVQYILKALDLRGYGEKFLSDFANYWWIVLLSLLMAMVLSFGWIFLLRLATAPVVWISVILCVAVLILGTCFSFYKYDQLLKIGDNIEDDIFLPPILSNLSSYYYNKTTWLVLGIIFAILTLIILLFLIFLFSRIRIAIELIEEASKAVGSMMEVLFFPIVPFLVEGLVILWFLVVTWLC